METINIGYGSMVSADKVVCIIRFHGERLRKDLRELENSGRYVNNTFGKKLRSLIYTSDGRVIGSSISVEALRGRCEEGY